jgi:hypothetical protein
MAGMAASSVTDAVINAVSGADPRAPLTVMVREAMGLLLVTLLESPKVIGVISTSLTKSMCYMHYLCVLNRGSWIRMLTISRL